MRPSRASEDLPRRPSYIISRASQEPLAKSSGVSAGPLLSRADQELQSISRASLEAFQSLPRSSCKAPESFTITSDEVAQRMPGASLARASQESIQSLLRVESLERISRGLAESSQDPLTRHARASQEPLRPPVRASYELLMRPFGAS